MAFGDKHKKKTAGPIRIIDGIPHQLMLWAVIEERPDGIPITLRLCQDHEKIGDIFTTDEQRANAKQHLLWTPTKFIAPVPS